MEDFFSKLKETGFKPSVNFDGKEEKIYNGAYLCNIESIENKAGVSKSSGAEYDMWVMKYKVVETVEGDDATGHTFDVLYSNDEKGISKLLNDLASGDIMIEIGSKEGFLEAIPTIIGTPVKLRAWLWKDKNKQSVKVVREFKLGRIKKTDPTTTESSTPF